MKIPIIAGPTGVGKTELVLSLAQKLNAELICMDSRQIYKYMDIGTAKPTIEEMQKIPHHLFDFKDPSELYTAFDFRHDALEKIKDIVSRGKLPILVGGTGLYADGLMKGFVDVESDYGLRTYLRKLEETETGILRKLLSEIDPETTLKLSPNDIKRTIRALEVYINTGKKLSKLYQEQKIKDPGYDFSLIVLDRDRKELHERINQRTDLMLKSGFIDEVKKLLNQYSEDLNALNTIGYKEVISYLKETISYEEMVHLIKKETRNYARRQIIYFRRFENASWFILNNTNKDFIESEIIKNIRGE